MKKKGANMKQYIRHRHQKIKSWLGQKEIKTKLISAALCLLFFYAAYSKLSDYDGALQDMRNQVFPRAVADVFTWFIPCLESLAVLLLLFPSGRIAGLWLSFGLMAVFSLYIAIVMTKVFGRVPCSCGGILEDIPYPVHLAFNLVFVALAVWGLYLQNQWIKLKYMFHFKRRKEVAPEIG
ncbi:hypothetical protein GCM10023231_18460 [Olivibacter ginsenosidimutans]|uniref:Methylamine utilisation protein MauE domain-containing protein n=1 Tax=Olivibacter ginsenosidimutans TaxID=1176537 RepID=A0ABP9B8X2_9SPHI